MLLFYVAALCAYFVKGVSGFANTLVFTSILSFGTDNVAISPVDVLLGYFPNIIMAWQNRRSLNIRIWGPPTALMLLGSVPGILLLKNTDARLIKIIFGGVIIAIGLEMLLRGHATRTGRGAKVGLAVIGLLSGALCGLYGVGALLSAYMSRATTSGQAFKANMCAVFVIENTFRIIVYAVTGILTLWVLRQALLLAPAMLAGLFLGMKSAGFLSEAAVKRLVIVLLLISGAALIITNLL